jgi:hypothetical protein
MLPTYYEVELRRVEHNGRSGLRTTVVKGYCRDLPAKDTRFKMLSDPLDKNMDVRFIKTSLIQAMEETSNKGDRTFSFETLNSHYLLRVIGPLSSTAVTTYNFLLDPTSPLNVG